MKKLNVFFGFLLLFSLLANAQTLHFQNLANMDAARGAIASAADSNFIYVCNGYSDSAQVTTEIERYDINKNQWSVFTNSLIAKKFSSSVIVGNNLYLFNGLDGDDRLNSRMEVVNLKTGAVTYSSHNPFPTKGGGAAVWNGIIYVFGGSYKDASDKVVYSNKLYSFNTVTKQWTHLASMKEAKETKGEIVEGKLYVIGGYYGSESKKIEQYDIKANKWTKLMEMPTGVSGHATAVSSSKIYIIGDYNSLTHVGCYDANNNIYTDLQAADIVGRRHAGAQVVKNKLYIMGGNQDESINSSLKSVQVATY